MSVLIVRDAMLQQLQKAVAPLKVCTPEGDVLGYFTPSKPEKLNLDPGISDEEMRKRLAQGGGRPMKDALNDLRKKYDL